MVRPLPRFVLPSLILGLVLAALVLWTGSGALGRGQVAAAGAVNIAAGTEPDNRPALAISPGDDRICATWATFGETPDAYVRVYTIAAGSWSPPLSSPALNLSESPGENTQTVRCAIDLAGNVHVVWQEGGNKRLEYRRLPAGADPASLAGWTPKQTIPTPDDAQWADLAASYSEGRIWVAYYALAGDTYNLFVQSWTAAGGWSAAQQLTTSGGQYPRIAVDNAGTVHLIYRAGGAIAYRSREATTGTWAPAGQLPGSGGAYEQTGLAVNRTSGDVHAVYSGEAGGGRAVYYVKKTGGAAGTAFAGPIRLTGVAGNYVVPRIAWSPTGRLVMVSDLREGAGSLVSNTSVNNGLSWVGPVPVAEGTRAQWPWVVASAAGTAYIAYWDTDDHNISFTTLGPSGTPPGPPAPTPASPTATRPLAPLTATSAPRPATPTPRDPPGATATPRPGPPVTSTPRPTATPPRREGTRPPTATARPSPASTPSSTPRPGSLGSPSPAPTGTPRTMPTAAPGAVTASPRPAAAATATPVASRTATPDPPPGVTPTSRTTPIPRPISTATPPPTMMPSPTVRATPPPTGAPMPPSTPTPIPPPAPTRPGQPPPLALVPTPTSRVPSSPTPPRAPAVTARPPASPAPATTTALSVTTAVGVPVRIVADGTGQGRRVTSVTQGASGTVTSDREGGLTYAPRPGFAGIDRFVYTLADRHGEVATLAVTVTVAAIPSGLPDTGGGGGSRDASLVPYLAGIPTYGGLLIGMWGWRRRGARRRIRTLRVASRSAGR